MSEGEQRLSCPHASRKGKQKNKVSAADRRRQSSETQHSQSDTPPPAASHHKQDNAEEQGWLIPAQLSSAEQQDELAY